MKISYYNYKRLSKELTKDLNVSRTTVEVLEGVFYWALHKNSTKDTIAVRGKRRAILLRLEELGLVKTHTTHRGNLGASINFDCELDRVWYN